MTPFLLAAAVAAILFSSRLSALLRRVFPGRALMPVAAVLMFFAGVYGGYFGAGVSLMLMAVLMAVSSQPLVEVNAVKNLFAFMIASLVMVPLVLSDQVVWPAAGLVLLGGLVGGFLGGHLTRWLPERVFRVIIVLVGLVLTASFLWRS